MESVQEESSSTKMESVQEESSSTKMESVQEESSSTRPSRIPGVSGMPDIPMDQILHYVEHPELEPPLTIKNMVNLFRMMEEDEENSASDSSSDIFYSSDEEEKVDDAPFKKADRQDQQVYTTSKGIHVGNAFFTNNYLARLNYVYVRGKDLILHAEYSNEIYVPLSENVEPKNIIQVFEEWTDIY